MEVQEILEERKLVKEYQYDIFPMAKGVLG